MAEKSILWKTETRKINELKPYEFNPRSISKEQIKKLKSSIAESGYNAPILVDRDYTIIAGHQRWHVLKLLKYKEVDIRIPSRKLTEQEFKRINIQDNVDFGTWDFDILANNFDLMDLQEWGIDVDLPGQDFDPAEETEADRLDKKKLITCPACQHEFEN